FTFAALTEGLREVGADVRLVPGPHGRATVSRSDCVELSCQERDTGAQAPWQLAVQLEREARARQPSPVRCPDELERALERQTSTRGFAALEHTLDLALLLSFGLQADVARAYGRQLPDQLGGGERDASSNRRRMSERRHALTPGELAAIPHADHEPLGAAVADFTGDGNVELHVVRGVADAPWIRGYDDAFELEGERAPGDGAAGRIGRHLQVPLGCSGSREGRDEDQRRE